MTWLFEEPIWIGIIGALAAAMCIGGWVKTGKKWLIGLFAAVVAVMVLFLVMERLVKTDREQVERNLFDIARAMEANDIDRVVNHIHSRSVDLQAEARSHLKQHRVTTVDIKHNLKIEVKQDHTPPSAVATFNVELRGDFYNRQFSAEKGLIFLTVRFLKENSGEWKIASYQAQPVQNAFYKK